MSDLRPKHTTIELDGKEYGLLFNINAIDEIQDRFDIPISQLGELMADERKVFKFLKELLAILINEAIDDSESEEKHVTPQFVGRKIDVKEIKNLKGKIFEAFSSGLPKSEEDDSPNVKSE